MTGITCQVLTFSPFMPGATFKTSLQALSKSSCCCSLCCICHLWHIPIETNFWLSALCAAPSPGRHCKWKFGSQLIYQVTCGPNYGPNIPYRNNAIEYWSSFLIYIQIGNPNFHFKGWQKCPVSKGVHKLVPLYIHTNHFTCIIGAGKPQFYAGITSRM